MTCPSPLFDPPFWSVRSRGFEPPVMADSSSGVVKLQNLQPALAAALRMPVGRDAMAKAYTSLRRRPAS
jgi:hypothetical protein